MLYYYRRVTGLYTLRSLEYGDRNRPVRHFQDHILPHLSETTSSCFKVIIPYCKLSDNKTRFVHVIFSLIFRRTNKKGNQYYVVVVSLSGTFVLCRERYSLLVLLVSFGSYIIYYYSSLL
jgi:hypothetical protein